MGEWKFAQMILVTWQRWLPCPYMVKTLKNRLLRNQKADDLESWYASSGARVLPNLLKWWPWIDLDLFYGKIKFGPYAFIWEKGKTMDFSDTIVVYDLKLATDDRSDKKFLLTSKLYPLGTVCPLPRGYIHVLNHEKNCIKSDFKDIFWNLQQMTEVTRCSCWRQNFVPWGLTAPAAGLYTCIKSWKNCIKSDF